MDRHNLLFGFKLSTFLKNKFIYINILLSIKKIWWLAGKIRNKMMGELKLKSS